MKGRLPCFLLRVSSPEFLNRVYALFRQLRPGQTHLRRISPEYLPVIWETLQRHFRLPEVLPGFPRRTSLGFLQASSPEIHRDGQPLLWAELSWEMLPILLPEQMQEQAFS
jgi:hypothetical protein